MCKNAQQKNQPLGGELTSAATAYCSLARQQLGLLGVVEFPGLAQRRAHRGVQMLGQPLHGRGTPSPTIISA